MTNSGRANVYEQFFRALVVGNSFVASLHPSGASCWFSFSSAVHVHMCFVGELGEGLVGGLEGPVLYDFLHAPWLS